MMTSTEWYDWISYHGSLFSGFAEWLMSDERSEAIIVWYGELAPFDVDVVKRASVELVRSIDKPPGFTNHLAAILDRCRQIRNRRRTEQTQRVRQCGYCRDTGLVDVRLREGIRGAFRTAGGAEVETGVVACQCSRGEPYKRRDDGHGFVPFDERLMEVT